MVGFMDDRVNARAIPHQATAVHTDSDAPDVTRQVDLERALARRTARPRAGGAGRSGEAQGAPTRNDGAVTAPSLA